MSHLGAWTTNAQFNLLERHGIKPAPKRNRKTTLKEFLSRPWELIVAANFFSVEVWIRRGLKRFLVFHPPSP